MTARRELLRAAAFAIPATALGAAKKQQKKEEAEVAPAEDLMREHGVLRRSLLVYEEWMRRVDAREPIPDGALGRTAKLIRRFIEDYHEKTEEEEVFPRLEKAGKLVALCTTLRQQHAAGRKITAQVIDTGDAADARPRVAEALRAFIRMYRPHAAREDTVLFPAFHELVGEKLYEKLGDEFEDREHRMFGQDGFEMAVKQVAELEETFGIANLASFTPK
jgi:hemerythrin-like domain-containing protein